MQQRCASVPCPWCLLHVGHNMSDAALQDLVMESLARIETDGGSVYEIALLMWCRAWVSDHHNVLSPSSMAQVLPVLPPSRARQVAQFFDNHIAALKPQFLAPCAPAPRMQSPASSSAPPASSSAAAASTTTVSAIPAAADTTETDDLYHDDSEYDSDCHYYSYDEKGRPHIVEIKHPHFQFQAGKPKKKQKWQSYNEPWQTRLRKWWNLGTLEPYAIDWFGDKSEVTMVDLHKWTQKNLKTNSVRKVRRL